MGHPGLAVIRFHVYETAAGAMNGRDSVGIVGRTGHVLQIFSFDSPGVACLGASPFLSNPAGVTIDLSADEACHLRLLFADWAS